MGRQSPGAGSFKFGGPKPSAPKGGALQNACRLGEMDSVKIKLKHGEDINGIDKPGYSPLSAAAEGNQLEAITYLLKHGASVNLKNKNDMSALSVAVYRNLAPICKL